MAQDPYADAPVTNPYDSRRNRFSSGVARQQRVIEAAYDDNRRKQEEETRIAASRKADADRVTKANITAQNSRTKERAQESGTADYMAKDKDGVLQSALSPEQTETFSRQRQEDDQKEASITASKMQTKMLGRQMKEAKDNVLTDSSLNRKKEEIEQKKRALINNQVQIEEGNDVDFYEKENIKNQDEINTLNGEIASHDKNQIRMGGLQDKLQAHEDLISGIPEGMPIAVPEDPLERKDFINAYSSRATRLNTQKIALAENAKMANVAFEERNTELREQYNGWLAEGVTPEQQESGFATYSEEVSKANVQYIRERFDYAQGIRSIKDEDLELSLIAPLFQEAAEAQKAWKMEDAKEAKTKQDEIFKGLLKKEDDNISEIGSYTEKGKKLLEERKAAMMKLRNDTQLTPEERKEKLKQIDGLQEMAAYALQDEIAQFSEHGTQLREILLERAGPNILSLIGENGFSKKEGKDDFPDWQVPLFKDSNKSGKFSTTGGNAFENVGGAIMTGLGNVVEGSENFLRELAPGKQYRPLAQIGIFQKNNGLTDAQMKKHLDDIQIESKPWTEYEATRVRKDGSLMFNPSLNLLAEGKYDEYIRNSDAPQFTKSGMMDEDVKSTHLHSFASEASRLQTLASASQYGVPTPDEFFQKEHGWMMSGGTSEKPPETQEWMAEYLKRYGESNNNSIQAIVMRYPRSFFTGVGKAHSAVAGIGALLNIDGAREAAMDIAASTEEQRAGYQAAGGKIGFGVSSVLDIIGEEGPSLLATLPIGGVGGAVGKGLFAAKGAFGGAVRMGAGQAGQAAMKSFVTKSAIAGSSIGSGLQSAGLNWQQFYSEALTAEETKLGRNLTPEEKETLSNSEAVQGRAISAGLLTSAITGAFGAGAEGAVLKSIIGGTKTATVRDFWRTLKRKGMTDKEVWSKASSAVLDLAKTSGIEGAEEFTDEFMQALAFDSSATMEDALKRGWEAGKAGLVLGGAIRAATSANTTGITTANASDPEAAMEALQTIYGSEGKYSESEVEDGLALIGYNPAKGSVDGEVAIGNLKVAIDSIDQLSRQEKDADSELTRATDAGDTDRIAKAQRALTNTRQARAVIRIANGTPIDQLTSSEQRAVGENLDDGTPVYEDIDGEIILTDSAISKLAKQLPEAAQQLVGLSESARRKEVSDATEKKAASEERAAKKVSQAASPAPNETKPVATEAPTEAGADPRSGQSEEVATTKEEGLQPIRPKSGKPYPTEKSAQATYKARVKSKKIDAADYEVAAVEGGFEISPTGGKSAEYIVQLTDAKGSSRPVKVQANTKSEAVDAAIKQVKPGESVNPASVVKQAAATTAKAKPAAKKAAEPAAAAAPAAKKVAKKAAKKTANDKLSDELDSEIAAKKAAKTAAELDTELADETDAELDDQLAAELAASLALQGKTSSSKAKPAPLVGLEDLTKALDDSFTSVSEAIAGADIALIPANQNWQITENDSLILREGLSQQDRKISVIQALVSIASDQSLNTEEGNSLFAGLPENIRDLIKSRGRMQFKRELSDAEAARFLLKNILTDNVLSSTIRKHARSGDKKVLGQVLKFFRNFVTKIRSMMDGASKQAKRELQFYERMTLAILYEMTDARALDSIGISLPQTRLTSTQDVVLPPNIQKKLGGYLVRLPDGSRQTAKTVSEARAINANKYEKHFERQVNSALAVAALRGGVTVEEGKKELQANVTLMIRAVEAIASKTQISKEAIFARIKAKFADGETKAILNEWSKARKIGDAAKEKEAWGLFNDKLAEMQRSDQSANIRLGAESLSASARAALATNKVSTDLSMNVSEGNLDAIESMRAARRQFLTMFGGKETKANLAKVKGFFDKKSELQDELSTMAIEDFLLNPSKKLGGMRKSLAKKKATAKNKPLQKQKVVSSGESFVKRVKEINTEIMALDRNIETAMGFAEDSYAKDGPNKQKKVGTRGFAVNIDKDKVLVGFSRDSDASTVMHEFVHVLQKLSDPRTGKPLLDEALGTQGKRLMDKWIQKTYPDAKRGDYEWSEAMAEGMEAFLMSGGKKESDISDAFATLAGSVSRIYDGQKGRPGFDIDEEVTTILDRLFEIEPVKSNAINVRATRAQAMFVGVAVNSTIFSNGLDGEMAPPTVNGKKQVGFKKEKPATFLAKSLQNMYGEVRVAKHDGKYYAVIDTPSLDFDTKANRTEMIANLQDASDSSNVPAQNKDAADRARARTSKTSTEDRQKAIDEAQDFNLDGTKKTKETRGNRANISSDLKTRNQYDSSKQIYDENFIAENWDDWKKGAGKVLSTIPVADVEAQIFYSAENDSYGGGPEFQIAAKRVVANRFQQAMISGNQADMDYAMSLAQAEQEMRGDVGRTLSSMQDPFMSPQQRAAYALGTSIHTTPPGQKDQLKRKHGAKDGGPVPKENRDAFNEDMLKLQKSRLEKARKLLAKEGITLEEIFNAQRDGVAIGTSLDNEALAKLSEKQQQVVIMMRESKSPEDIKAVTGVSEEGQQKAMQKYRRELRDRVFDLVAKGYRVESMQSFAEGSPPPEGSTPGTEEDVDAIIETSLGGRLTPKKGFNPYSPSHVNKVRILLDDLDLDFLKRTEGTWIANVFSAKTSLINMTSIPFGLYASTAERAGEAAFSKLIGAGNAEGMKSFPELKYMARGIKQFYRMAFLRAFKAYDSERSTFNTFAKGEDVNSAGDTNEDLHGYASGHLLDYLDIALEKAGFPMERPSIGKRLLLGEKGAKTKMQAGKSARVILRVNLAVDDFVGFMMGGAEVGGIAYRLGKAKGLKGDALEQFITREMTVQGSSSWVMAAEVADTARFVTPLPKKGDKLTNGIDVLSSMAGGIERNIRERQKSLREEKEVYKVTTHGSERIGNLTRIESTRALVMAIKLTTVPFNRTLWNLLSEGYKRIPNPIVALWSIGHVGKYAMFNRGKKVDPNIARHVTNLNRQFNAWVGSYLLSGLFEGDDDDREKRILITGSPKTLGENDKSNATADRREGVEPYSVRIHIGDYKKTFNYGKLDPASTVIATIADGIRNVKQLGDGKIDVSDAASSMLIESAGGQLGNKSMLSNVNDVVMMVNGQQSIPEFLARNVVTMLVPNVLRQPLRDSNEYYDARLPQGGMQDFKDTFLYEMYPQGEGAIFPANPFVDKAVKRDGFGKEVKRPYDSIFAVNWLFQPRDYEPNQRDAITRREQLRDPDNTEIKMTGDRGNTYVFTDPSTGLKENRKLTPVQYAIRGKIERSMAQSKRGQSTIQSELQSEIRATRTESTELAREDPKWMREEARQTIKQNAKKK
jgi:hypothetical protein